MFDPQSPQGLAISNLFIPIIVIMVLVIVLISGLVTFAAIRYRWRGEEGEPSQDHGKPRLELIWTITPIVLLIGVFIFTIIAMSGSDPKVPTGQADITVIGHQWWWEFRYPGQNIVTANEMHIPAGKRVLLDLQAADVTHDFWVPALGRKMDMLPGQTNRMYFQGDTPGTYEGICAQYCGVEHAWMLYKVVVQPQADYDAWVSQQEATPPLPAGVSVDVSPTPSVNIGATPTGVAATPPAGGYGNTNTGTEIPQDVKGLTTPVPNGYKPPTNTDDVRVVAHGYQLFSQLTCISCHNIGGVPGPSNQNNAYNNVGPNLTHLASRQILAAGVLTNTPQNLKTWLLNPQAVKPGNHMPNLNLTDQEADALVAYLETLR